MAWDSNLEGPAKTFAGSTANRIRCLAGPGTGKTYALMKRIQRLLEENTVDPSRILVITLTRTAADDLRQNLQALGANGASRIYTSTLHSFCFSALMQEDILEITHRVPRILADFERDILIKDMPDTLGNFTNKKEMLTELQAAWSTLEGDPINDEPGSIRHSFYREILKSFSYHKCMLVGELVPLALKYLSENPFSTILDKYDHILVDEYQDLNRADHGVIEVLTEAANRREGHLAVIGDDDQCIYVALRHAHPRGIVDFQTDEDIPLNECRRCPKRIVEMAQNLISFNEGREKPPLVPLPTNSDGKVHNIIFPTMVAEAEGLANFVHSRIESGRVNPGEVLILANWRKIAYAIRDNLINLGHDALSYFREEPLDTLESKKSLTLLTLLAKPDDRVALRSYLALSNQRENRAGYRRVFNYALENALSVPEVLERLARNEMRIPHTATILTSWRILKEEIQSLDEYRQNMPGLIEKLCPNGKQDTQRLRGTMELALANHECPVDLKTLLDSIRVQIGTPEVPLDASFVRLMSLHKSKGLTVKLVVIAGLVEGLIPRTPKEGLTLGALTEHEYEQRRILFVGITRPTEEIVLSRFQTIDNQSAYASGAATGRWLHHGIKTTVSSTMFRELGPALPPIIRSDDWTY